MRHALPPHRKLLMPLHRASGVLNIKVEHQPRENHLDLVGGEEASGTRMPAVPKRQVRFVGGDELVARVICGRTTLAQLVRAEAVERLAVGVVL
jgi:hypothetical protein